MKPVATKGSPLPGIERGDQVFFKHPKLGPARGKVVCHGQHGATIEHEKEQHKVRWADLLGHHSRVSHDYEVIDRGDAGAIVQDESGRRRFVAGEVPEEDKRPAEPGADDLSKVKKLADEATKREPLAKSLPADRVVFWRL